MYLTKIPHPDNFAFATSYDACAGTLRVGQEVYSAEVRRFEGHVLRIAVRKPGFWPDSLGLVDLLPPPPVETDAAFRVDADFGLSVEYQGRTVLRSAPGRAFGLSGPASLFCFELGDRPRFFGMGEKTFGRLEVSGLRTKFWNVDAWADFHFAQWDSHPCDPYYFSLPYLVVERDGAYVGLLVENPCAPFFDTGSDTQIPTDDRPDAHILAGAEDGPPTLWVILGPTLPELTRKLHRLLGTTPLPPLWALGYHQSRWGYAGEDHLRDLDERFTRHDIPCDALWLDIDYMDGFRVFTHSRAAFPKGVRSVVDAVGAFGRRVVPILDPGVKLEPGNEVYDSAVAADVLCRNAAGGHFVGMVWPGRTVFPDFTMPEGRAWWAGHAERFFANGYGGAWLDMNDPSTGAVDPTGMLFRNGAAPHSYFHNQYALGMQMATYDGFRRAHPGRRPFLLSRSGWIGTSRYAAVWTGDNVSNRFHLRSCVPTALNMALSGQPFCGPDIGGFGGDTNEMLMIDWVKACCLFPFFRNHCVLGVRPQEPWTFGAGATRLLRRFIRLRYRLLPYLYNLFIDQEERGEPALRPTLYEFPDAPAESDAFFVGSWVLQAPFLGDESEREVRLPGRSPWFDARTGQWLRPGRHRLAKARDETPLFFRSGAIVPMWPDDPDLGGRDLRRVEFHVFLRRGSGRTVYRCDDGETFGYRRGERSSLEVLVRRRGDLVEIETRVLQDGYGPVDATFVVYGDVRRVTIGGKRTRLRLRRVRWTGRESLSARLVRLD